ncbi:MAG: hypothetical protein LBT48_01495 [Prevotellaceae bacterium]|jgi:hypothetical protein|nr:hypothetical protein [Prevotellaceae bacterium]
MMKIHYYYLLGYSGMFLAGCTSDPYYQGLNNPPELTTTIDLSITDTLKIGKLRDTANSIYYDFPILATDVNQNLQTLTVSVSDSIIVTDEHNIPVPLEYNYAKEFSIEKKTFRLIPTATGEYDITVQVKDKFGKTAALKKNLYVFDNYPPVVKAKAYYYFSKSIPPTPQLYLDISGSYDADSIYGGYIVKFHVEYFYSWESPEYPYFEATPEEMPQMVLGDDANVPLGYFIVWAIDNDGTESEHIRIESNEITLVNPPGE